MHSVNSLGLFLCYKYAALKMQELGNKSGRIIGASSGAGRVGAANEAKRAGGQELTAIVRPPDDRRV